MVLSDMMPASSQILMKERGIFWEKTRKGHDLLLINSSLDLIIFAV